MLVTTISFYFLAGLVTYYIVFVYRNRRILKFAWNQHAFFLPVLPIVGTSYVVLVTLFKGVPVNLLTCAQWAKKNVGYPVNFWLGSDYSYVTTDPEEIKVIFHHPKCQNKGKIYEIFKILFPNSMLLTPYEKWKIQRKLFQNSYKPSVLKTFTSTFYNQSCKLLEDIKSRNKIYEPFEYFAEYSFVNFFLTSAALQEEKCYPYLKKIVLLIWRIQKNVMLKIVDPFLPVNVWLRIFPNGRRYKKNENQLLNIIRDLSKLKHEQYCSKKESADKDKAMPLFDLMMDATSKNMDEREIFDDIIFFAMAATETTGNALAFCFMLLGMHPEIQVLMFMANQEEPRTSVSNNTQSDEGIQLEEKLYQEVINEVNGTHISNDDLPKLKYTEAVINETMRIFPPVPIIQRYVGADVDLGTQVIPEGANFGADIFHLHREGKYWPNPLKFDPTRFLPENASKIIPYTFMPFSTGPRDCLGKGQAMILMKLTVATLIRKLKIMSSQKSIDQIVLTSLITMKPVHPIDCQFSLRLAE